MRGPQLDYRISVAIYLVSAVVLTPFAAVHAAAGQHFMAVVVGITSGVFFALGYLTYRLRSSRHAYVLQITGTAAVLIVLKHVGLGGVFWAYPLTLVNYYVARVRIALLANLAFLLLAAPLLEGILDPPNFWRVLASLLLTNMFALVFALGVGRREDRLSTLAGTDALTGVENRRAMDQALAEATLLRDEHNVPSSLILFDVDHFKAINDRHGHGAGDEALRALVEGVRTRIRETDRLFRFGGEEFVVLMPRTPLAEASNAADSLRARIEALELREVGQLTISAGVAELTRGESIQSWLERCDAALYDAKHQGRNQVVTAPRSAAHGALGGSTA